MHWEVQVLRRGSLQAQPMIFERPTRDARLQIQVSPGLEAPIMIREREDLVLLRVRPILPAEILSLHWPARIRACQAMVDGAQERYLRLGAASTQYRDKVNITQRSILIHSRASHWSIC